MNLRVVVPAGTTGMEMAEFISRCLEQAKANAKKAKDEGARRVWAKQIKHWEERLEAELSD